ncbi:MAG: hypothetical protein MUE81_04225 [Thermoflexibacter sp.]|jgi:hypothetical protein|nr:hypothetical protein [Thermoflexibacter sp.]
MKKKHYFFKSLMIAILLWSLYACTKEGFSDAGGSTGKGGSLARFAIVGDYLYTVDNTSLRVFDIKNKVEPQFIGSQNLGFGIETIFPYSRKLFLGANDGMYIVDIDKPNEPKVLSIYRHIMSCDPVVVQGNYAYVTLRSGTPCQRGANQLDVVDISNLSAPKLMANYPMSNPIGLGVDGSQLFVCDAGLKVFDIDQEKPFQLTEKQRINISNAFDVIPWYGRLLVISSDGLYQYSYLENKMNLISKIPIVRK